MVKTSLALALDRLRSAKSENTYVMPEDTKITILRPVQQEEES